MCVLLLRVMAVRYVHDRMNKEPAWQQIKVLMSDSNQPGEGEHKIANYIRQMRYPSSLETRCWLQQWCDPPQMGNATMGMVVNSSLNLFCRFEGSGQHFHCQGLLWPMLF